VSANQGPRLPCQGCGLAGEKREVSGVLQLLMSLKQEMAMVGERVTIQYRLPSMRVCKSFSLMFHATVVSSAPYLCRLQNSEVCEASTTVQASRSACQTGVKLPPTFSCSLSTDYCTKSNVTTKTSRAFTCGYSPRHHVYRTMWLPTNSPPSSRKLWFSGSRLGIHQTSGNILSRSSK